MTVTLKTNGAVILIFVDSLAVRLIFVDSLAVRLVCVGHYYTQINTNNVKKDISCD
jgi:hypothetical protein